MTIESCITYPAKSLFLMVREPLISICKLPMGSEMDKMTSAPDPQAAAVILHKFIFWTDGKLDLQHQTRYQEAAAASEGETNQQDNGLWIYKDYDELKIDLMNLFGRNKIIENVQWLVSAGYLKRRTNPRYRWDKTLQYLVDVDLVQSHIDSLSKFNSKLSSVPNQTNESVKNKRAIPKKTTEKTKKEEKEITTSAATQQSAVTSSSEWENVAQEADDSSMFTPLTGKQKSAQADISAKRLENATATTPPPPVPPTPAPIEDQDVKVKAKRERKPNHTALVIDAVWGKGVSGALLPMLMGKAKKKPHNEFNIEGGMTEVEIFAFGRWYKKQNAGLNLPEVPYKVEGAIESFRNAIDYDGWMTEAEKLFPIYFPKETPAAPVVEERATPEEVAAYRQQIQALGLGDVFGDLFDNYQENVS